MESSSSLAVAAFGTAAADPFSRAPAGQGSRAAIRALRHSWSAHTKVQTRLHRLSIKLHLSGTDSSSRASGHSGVQSAHRHALGSANV